MDNSVVVFVVLATAGLALFRVFAWIIFATIRFLLKIACFVLLVYLLINQGDIIVPQIKVAMNDLFSMLVQLL